MIDAGWMDTMTARSDPTWTRMRSTAMSQTVYDHADDESDLRRDLADAGLL